jgi:GNAT superfamily N-acetyltransferase
MSPTQLTIRQATPDDAQEITTLHAAGWRKGYAAFFDPEVLEQAIEERRTRWTDLLKKRDREGTLLFVGEQDGMIVAFAHAGPARDHPGDLEIYSFYTHPTYWGSGIGRRLMMHVLAFALTRGYVRMYLYVYSQSVRARRFTRGSASLKRDALLRRVSPVMWLRGTLNTSMTGKTKVPPSRPRPEGITGVLCRIDVPEFRFRARIFVRIRDLEVGAPDRQHRTRRDRDVPDPGGIPAPNRTTKVNSAQHGVGVCDRIKAAWCEYPVLTVGHCAG